MPELRTRTKMKNVASDCARRENVPWHILSYNWKITGFFQIKCKKGRKENGTENVDCIWTCSQKSAASKSQDDVSGSTGADFIGSAVYQQSINRKYENLY